MSEIEKEQPEEEPSDPEESRSSRVSLDEMLDEVPSSNHLSSVLDSAEKSGLLIGQVLEESNEKNQVLIHWVDEENNTHEQWLDTVRNLELEKDDEVLLSKPQNRDKWIVTDVLHTTVEGNIEETSEAEDEEIVVDVDGERVKIKGQNEIVLRCGQASITLRRNGRVIIRGTYVETRSKGTNRIKGGSVLIN